MRTMNRVTLMGHLASDPEARVTSTGKDVATFSIATHRGKFGKAGEGERTTDFHRLVVWDGLARIAAKYLTKGMPVYVEGRLSNRSYEGQDGKKKYKTEISLDRLNILDWKKSPDGADELTVQEIPTEEPVTT